MKPIPFFVAASLLALASPALADTIRVEPGADAQSRLQSALIDAKPGDIVEIGAGRFDLTDGLSLDVDMDLSPFAAINPCGYAGLRVTQTRDLGITLTLSEAGETLCRHLRQQLDKKHG